MPDPVWLPDVLRAAGLEVREYPGWRDRGHGDFGTIWGVVCHHTGSFGATARGIAEHPDLGLCSQLHLDSDGVYTICGVGIAWHAGMGAYPGLPTNNANQCTIGIEAANDGGGRPGLPHRESWPDAQYDAYFRGVAAILDHLGQPATHAIGHKEWAGAAQGKWDPGAIDMNIFRADVARAMAGQPAQRGAGTVWGETFENFKKSKVSYGTAIYYIDQLVNAIADQVTRGWKQLGVNDKGEPLTLIDSQAQQSAALERIENRLDLIEQMLEAKA
ncbi:peptidoglycan recognition protein family protein [Nocardia asiatica]|uniref:peptidoglycan recognition protein family protein n=1 Tax=Nocardia asiatica TaxID=209252 RepID=UPI0024542F28|nr:N-acetylmuramoyl-L-alanine amidase [Nocardia asiatica]